MELGSSMQLVTYIVSCLSLVVEGCAHESVNELHHTSY